MKLIKIIDVNSFMPVIGVLSDDGFLLTKFDMGKSIEDVIAEVERSQPDVAAFILENAKPDSPVPEPYVALLTYVPSEIGQVRQEAMLEWKRQMKENEAAYDAKQYPFKRHQ